MQAFCLMTVGRCGSTALMDALRSPGVIATPSCDVSSDDEELLHPDQLARYGREYARLTGRTIRSNAELMQAFFHHHRHQAYAGFKSMPNRHRNFDHFVRRPEIQFISLLRRDVQSTVASFLTAMQFGCWRRAGEPQERSWTFLPEAHGAAASANLQYVRSSIRQIESMPTAINLEFEDLCRADFRDSRLDDFFARPVRIDHPKPPIHGSAYILNWPEFVAFLNQEAKRPLWA